MTWARHLTKATTATSPPNAQAQAQAQAVVQDAPGLARPTRPTPPRRAKVLVAMSGGVDSSVTAALLKDRGYEVVGCFMRNGATGEGHDPTDDRDDEAAAGGGCTKSDPESGAKKPQPKKHKQGCCSVNDAQDARLVAAMLDIPFYVVNFQRDFGRIMDYFTAEYNAGRTPNPCVRCNDWLKFGKLHDYARSIDADYVATGHYARIHREPAEAKSESGTAADTPDPPDQSDPDPPTARLMRGIDTDKDQSYVLFGTPAEQLDHMLLPIGEFRKDAVRQIAEDYHLPTFDKPDSQEICFVPDNDYAGLVERRTEGGFSQGTIRDPQGNTLATHSGHQRFTHGQRRGLNLALGYPVYVVEKDAATNTITVGSKDDLLAEGALASQVNWLCDRPAADHWQRCQAKIRYNAQPVDAWCRVRASRPWSSSDQADHKPEPDRAAWADQSEQLEVRFDQPLQAVTPGQAIVCYGPSNGNLAQTVLGGGWIDWPIRDAAEIRE